MLSGRSGSGRRIPLTNLRPRRTIRCSNCGTIFKPTDTARDHERYGESHCPRCYEGLIQSGRKAPQLRVVGPPPPSLLLVDDDAILRSMLALFFHPLVGEIREADNGEAALAIASEKSPDVIVCDCRMPVMDGDEAGRRLRELLPDARIVSYSGMDADKPWADATVVKGTRDDLEDLRRAVLPDAD